MSGLELILAGVSAATSLASGAIAAAGTIAQGKAMEQAAKAEQRQLQRMASEELAVATRGAETKNKEVQGLKSRVQAVSASSGGMATDNSVLEVVGNIAKEGNVQTRDILRQGQVQGDDLLYRGRVGVNTAKINRDLSRMTAAGQVISATGDAFSKYGQGLPATSRAPSQRSWWG